MSGQSSMVSADAPSSSPARREGQITVLGLRTRLIESGPPRRREVVLFVHGMPGSALDWGPVQEAVGEIAPTISFDMPGFGVAHKPRDTEYSFSAAAVFIAALLDALEVERVHLVAHDSGGVAGLVWAAAHPRAFLDATLLSTGVFVGYRWHPVAKAMRIPLVGEALGLLTTRRSFERGMHDMASRLPQSALDRIWSHFDHGTRRAMRRSYRASPPSAMERLVPTFRDLDRPALVIWGRNDTATPEEQAARQKLSFPSASISTLDCGHWPHLERPDEVISLVTPFLAEQITGGR